MALVDAKQIKRIVDKTIETIESSKNEMYGIVENARTEVEHLKRQLAELQNQVEGVIDEVDQLEMQDKLMRQKLVVVSKNFNKYAEQDIKEVYEKASEIRAKYYLKQQEEKNLRQRRTDMEQSLIKARYILETAEKLINQVAVAMSYLSNDMNSTHHNHTEDSVLLGIKILEAQEEERRRVSRDIHDGPAQSIANIVLKAEICKTLMVHDVNKGLNELEQLKDSVRETLNDIRKIIYDLRPMSIDDLGLIPTLRRFGHEFAENNQIKVTVETNKITKDIEKIIEVAVFRLTQEIFNNIKKHAKASNIEVKLSFGTKYLGLTISDDGIGFDYEEALEKATIERRSFGLLGIVERVEQLHGHVKYDSTLGQGTKIYIEIPINREVMIDEYQSNSNSHS